MAQAPECTYDFNELADRCETASGPDRELDAEIWLAATPGATRNKTGYTHAASGRWCDIDETRDPTGRLIIVPAYTSSIDAAETLVPSGFKWKLGYSKNVPHVAEVVDYLDGKGSYVSECDHSRALALCAAALRSRANS